MSKASFHRQVLAALVYLLDTIALVSSDIITNIILGIIFQVTAFVVIPITLELSC